MTGVIESVPIETGRVVNHLVVTSMRVRVPSRPRGMTIAGDGLARASDRGMVPPSIQKERALSAKPTCEFCAGRGIQSSWWCDFEAICVAHDNGSDVDDLRNEMYVPYPRRTNA